MEQNNQPVYLNENRKREWLVKPFNNGAPISRAREYFRSQLAKFRQVHPEFDFFLKQIGIILKKENNTEYKNLILFIDGFPETNWVSPSNSMFSVFIKLFNWCLSPSQASTYIKQCLFVYKRITNNNYCLGENYGISIARCRYDGQVRKFLTCTMLPNQSFNNYEDWYWFGVTFTTLLVDDGLNDIDLISDLSIDIKGKTEILEDSLTLFNRYQKKNFYRKLIWETIKQLEEKKAIKRIGQSNNFLGHYYYFEFRDYVGSYWFKKGGCAK